MHLNVFSKRKHSVIFIHGPPGTGKTVESMLVGVEVLDVEDARQGLGVVRPGGNDGGDAVELLGRGDAPWTVGL